MRRLLSALLALAAFFAGGAAFAAPPDSRFNATYFTNRPLITQDGKTVKFYDDLIKGKRVVISFAYLNCTDMCPLAISRLAEVKRRLGDAVGRDVFFYTITLDPARDTPELLKMYADAFDAGPGWQFLTGKQEDIDAIRHQLGERARKLTEHRSDLVLGNDPDGEWSRFSAFGEIAVFVETIRELDPAYRAQARSGRTDMAKAEAVRLGNLPGQAMFAKACSTCHTIGRGTLVGPDLKHVSARRNREWLKEFMMAPDRMRAKNDPVVMELRAKFRGVRMPNLGLLETDVADLLAYIEARSGIQDAGASPQAEAGASGG